MFDDALRQARSSGVQAAAIVSRDGTVLAADMPPGISRETFSIMCATIHGAGVAAASELRREHSRRILLESGDGRIVILEAGRRALLVLVTPPDADPDRVTQNARPLLDEIARETT